MNEKKELPPIPTSAARSPDPQKIHLALEFCSDYFKAYFSNRWNDESCTKNYEQPFEDIKAPKKHAWQYIYLCQWYFENHEKIREYLKLENNIAELQKKDALLIEEKENLKKYKITRFCEKVFQNTLWEI